MRSWAIAAIVVVAWAANACTTGPRRSDDAVDPAVYTTCQDPDAAAAWSRAQAALGKGDDAAALPDLAQVTQRCPSLVRAHLAYQDAARRIGGDAARTMIEFYRRQPDQGTPVAAYCRARLAETAYAQCNALQAIIAQDSSFAWAHLSLARVTRQQGRMVPAYEMYSTAIVNDPQLHEAQWERAQVLVELGRDQEAAMDFKAYLASRPGDLQAAREYVTLLLYRLGRVEEARVLLEQLEAKSPGDLSLRMDRAAALWRSNQPRAAADAYLDILRAAPKAGRAALNLGLLYYEVVPQDAAARRRFWPSARAAFRWFLDEGGNAEGHEQFERTLGVPFRMQRIAELLGPEPLRAVQLDDLRWPGEAP
jgi:tetratricopeptide (TPR) repeat protein